MNNLNPIIILPLICGIAFIVIGLIMRRFPSKNRNFYFGYKTKRSRQSDESWIFAQKYSSILLIVAGVFLALSSSLGFIIDANEAISSIIGISLVVTAILIIVISTEISLNKRFGSK